MEKESDLARAFETQLKLNVDRPILAETSIGIIEVSDDQIRIERDLHTNQKIINNYRVEEEIGKGSWGKVKACLDMRTGEKMAMKKFHKMILKKKTKITKDEQGNVTYKSQWDNVEQEIKIMRQCNHPNIIQIRAILHNDSQSKLYIILDYCELGDMLKWNEKTLRFSHITNVKTTQLKCLQSMMLDACLALKYLHEKDIIHRDIKPQNILVTHDFRAKLCDFGLAMKLNSPAQTIRGTEGTYHFMAPESLSDSETKSGYDGKKADIWSLGVTFYCMLYLRLPFYHDNLMNLFQTIQAKEPKYDLKMWCQAPLLIELLQKMLIKDPKKRIELSDIIIHPFFKETSSS